MDKTYLDIESYLADESFLRWLSDKASPEEAEYWSNWLNADPRNQKIYQEANRLWNTVRLQPEVLPDIEEEWQRLRARLHLNAQEKPQPAADAHPGARRVWLRYGALAVAALLTFFIWKYFPVKQPSNNSSYQIVTTEYGQRVRIALPEGTTVILNANSTLRYPTNWSNTTVRKFELQGEAYFMVARQPQGPQHLLAVNTSDGSVQVEGTRFVVYKRGQGTRVVVEEGRVRVRIAADSSARRKIDTTSVLLKPGYLLHFKKGNRTPRPRLVNVQVYTSWLTEQLVFDRTPFADIVRRLEETYGVQIRVKDPKLLKRAISGSIENSNLQIITEALAKALQVPVQRKGKIVIFG